MSDSFTDRFAGSANAREPATGPRHAAPSQPHMHPRTPTSSAPPLHPSLRPLIPVPTPFPPKRALVKKPRWRQPVTTFAIALIFAAQMLGTYGMSPWVPNVFIGGGLERIVDYAFDQGWGFASPIKTVSNALFCLYWGLMLVASSGLGADVPPRLMPGERGWQFNQKRVAYLGPLLVLLAGHFIGAFIAASGFWPLAIFFEIGGHLGMAGLLYIWLIPEGRRRLIIIEDLRRDGQASRIHISSGFYSNSKGRRWLAIRHDQLRGAELNDPLWARIFNTAHLELTYVDSSWQPYTQVIKCIGTKDDLSLIVSFLNGIFMARRPANYGQPIMRFDVGNHAQRIDEEWGAM